MQKIIIGLITLLFFYSCTTTTVSVPKYIEKDLSMENGNLVHFYFFSSEDIMWANFKNFVHKEFDINLSDESITKIQKSTWEAGDNFDTNLSSFMLYNECQFAISSFSESNENTTLMFYQLINGKEYSKKWVFTKPKKVNVETDIPWWLLFAK